VNRFFGTRRPRLMTHSFLLQGLVRLEEAEKLFAKGQVTAAVEKVRDAVDCFNQSQSLDAPTCRRRAEQLLNKLEGGGQCAR
jgi:hypothetical protein